jgi:hypothetical protein
VKVEEGLVATDLDVAEGLALVIDQDAESVDGH